LAEFEYIIGKGEWARGQGLACIRRGTWDRDKYCQSYRNAIFSLGTRCLLRRSHSGADRRLKCCI